MSTPQVAILMGSSSDREVMKPAVDMLKKFGAAHEAKVIPAHHATDTDKDMADTLDTFRKEQEEMVHNSALPTT